MIDGNAALQIVEFLIDLGYIIDTDDNKEKKDEQRNDNSQTPR